MEINQTGTNHQVNSTRRDYVVNVFKKKKWCRYLPHQNDLRTLRGSAIIKPVHICILFYNPYFNKYVLSQYITIYCVWLGSRMRDHRAWRENFEAISIFSSQTIMGRGVDLIKSQERPIQHFSDSFLNKN